MYAYYNNNHVNNVDINVNFAISIGAALLAAMTALVATIATVTAIIATSVVADKIIDNVQSKATTKSKAEPITKKPPKENHTVYTLRNESGVKYVGRTSRTPALRRAEHKLNSARSNLIFEEVATNLNKIQARGLEQILIEQYQTLNKTNLANNQRNGIAWDNPNRNRYMNAASLFLNENETYVGP